MDAVIARLNAEKPRRPSPAEIAASRAVLKNLTEDLDRFLAQATGRPSGHPHFVNA